MITIMYMIVIIIIKMINIIRKHGEVNRNDTDRLRGDKDPSISSVACFFVFYNSYIFPFFSPLNSFFLSSFLFFFWGLN